jgi:hypothetical protein
MTGPVSLLRRLSHRDPTIFDTIRAVENLARERGNTRLANELYAFGCDLGSPTEIPPFKLTPEHEAAAAEIARRRAIGGVS